ncbi:hypothetical protein J4209_05225 [Candidatus Woesearchaeota archaeon]|nr:hypothetical protein [Candidatus Woesearchaeota archaeon]
MITISTVLNHYKREDIQNEIIKNSQDREVAIKFGDRGFGKRPDTLKYPRDILELAKQGATSFHASEELWKNPLQLDPLLKKKDLEKLRIGWDLILDIDCPFLEYSKIAVDLIIKALKYHGINSISCKFSGNHGFHIAVPFEAFPKIVHDKEIKDLFPDGPRKIAFYLKEMIRNHLAKGILKNETIDIIAKKTDKKPNELIKNNQFDPFSILSLDTLLISSRHLYRMPYCFNEKSGLISIPINPDKVLEFNKAIANPRYVRISKYSFLDKSKIEKNEARKLIVQAFDFDTKIEETKIKEGKTYEMPALALQEQFFPPCIKNILRGLEDGKKRSLFVLINFLSSVGWDYDKIEKTLRDWNKRNNEPLREVYLIGQLRYHKQQKKKILPPNCVNQMYYKDFGVCKPDNLCSRIKNPVNYSRRKTFYLNKEKP